MTFQGTRTEREQGESHPIITVTLLGNNESRPTLLGTAENLLVN